MQDGVGSAAEPSSMKRSSTSMSCEEAKKNKAACSDDGGENEEIGKLRTVKSIHTRILHTST